MLMSRDTFVLRSYNKSAEEEPRTTYEHYAQVARSESSLSLFHKLTIPIQYIARHGPSLAYQQKSNLGRRHDRPHAVEFAIVVDRRQELRKVMREPL